MFKAAIYVSIDDVILTQKGSKPILLESQQFENSVMYLDVNTLEERGSNYYTYKDLGVLSSDNDLLVLWDGSRSGLVFKGKYGVVASTFTLLKPIGIERDYLFYFLKSNYDYLNGNTVGSGIPHINPELFYNLKLPYINKEQQKKHSKSIEEKLKIIPQTIKQQKNLIRQALINTNILVEEKDDMLSFFSEFRKAVLKKAFTGELTKSWRQNQSLQQAVSHKQHEKYFSEFSIPENWNWSNLSEIAKLSVGSTPRRDEESFWNGDIFWVSSGEVDNNYIYNTKEKITFEGVSKTRLKIYSNDTLLIGMIGEGKTRGRVAILKVPACINQNLCAIELSDQINPAFVWYYLQLRYDEIRKGNDTTRSNGSQTSLNSEIVGMFDICMPSYFEQCEIVSQIDILFANLTDVQLKYEEALRDLENLEKSILQQAYSEENFEFIASDDPLMNEILLGLKEEKNKVSDHKRTDAQQKSQKSKELKNKLSKKDDVLTILKKKEIINVVELWKESTFYENKDVEKFYEALIELKNTNQVEASFSDDKKFDVNIIYRKDAH